MIEIRHGSPSDREFWKSLDVHLSDAEFARKIRDGQAFVALEDGDPAGLLRYGLFWDSVPFCNLLYIREDRRGRGIGRAIMGFWEDEMRELGYDFVLVSTQSDEEAQHFYRKLGYRDCGCLLLDRPGHEQPAELFLLTDLRTNTQRRNER